MFEAKIKIKDSSELIKGIRQILEPEKDFKTSRAKYTLKKLGNSVTINVKAKDATAFRAVMSSITTQISIVEKIWKEINKNGKTKRAEKR